ncbi:hypothetical protein BXZ70DRAFT_633609 [Cristinia sonorae]|uniref:GATA-type domain-containing protein n=1 Tax=Cristinia sonorae TaxID=1940300 RepID=A0A8K0UGR7_9AGAR|nr:hypothetical protein BXZ70DRAFT_633609 [Cristinia sonorae]
MPHRVETSDRMSRHADDRNHYDHPSPPPIATLHHSPAPSGNSSISSPSPPLQQNPSSYYTAQSGAQPMHPGQQYAYPPPMNGGYPTDDRHQQQGVPLSTRAIRPAYVPTQAYPGQANYVIHTDDAATKLSDRVRRKCYNCRTTDTSTWRRSSLTPGKVLCNKCGLFERTHSRPRPEQFPHKRGPIVTTTFKSARTTPPASASGRLPSMNSQPMQQQLPPHHYDHPSIAPLMSSRGDASYASNGSLPDVRNLLNGPSSPGMQQQQVPQQQQHSQEENQGERSEQSVPQKRSASPLLRTSPTQSPRTEQRSPPYSYRTAA